MHVFTLNLKDFQTNQSLLTHFVLQIYIGSHLLLEAFQ